MTKPEPIAPVVFKDADDLIIWPWVLGYLAVILSLLAGVLLTASPENWQNIFDWHAGQSWADRGDLFVQAFRNMEPVPKAFGFALYLSLCSAVLPFPTSWIIAAVAMPEFAIGGSMLSTVAIVTLIGSPASVMANLNDYHIFTWMLRHHRLAKLRHTRIYNASAKWFARRPFLLLVIFNFLPIPVDVVRILAISYRYPRWPFVVANFLGRALRYSTIAALTYQLGDKGWILMVALLAVAIFLSTERLFRLLFKRLFRRGEIS